MAAIPSEGIFSKEETKMLRLSPFITVYCCTVAALLGLAGRKGAIRQGLDADLVEFDEEARVHAVMARGRFVPLEEPA